MIELSQQERKDKYKKWILKELLLYRCWTGELKKKDRLDRYVDSIYPIVSKMTLEASIKLVDHLSSLAKGKDAKVVNYHFGTIYMCFAIIKSTTDPVTALFSVNCSIFQSLFEELITKKDLKKLLKSEF